MLHIEDRWVWDSWVVDDGERFHLFFLQAPRELRDPNRRHIHATVGHASSVDLVSWTRHPDALTPGPRGSWDDLAIWTGSVIHDDQGRWVMFYTAISREDGIGGQRIGAAVSDDLITWERGAGPLVEVDSTWYIADPDNPTITATWRDPFAIRDPDGDGWHLLITARVAGAAPNDDGVVAHARSRDLVRWTLEPPLSHAGSGFGQLEVPQAITMDGHHLLLFTCHPAEQTAARRRRSGDFCTWSVPGPGPLGPWDVSLAQPFVADPHLFAARLVQRRDGGWVLLGFRNLDDDEDGSHLAIGDPIPVVIEDGRLVAAPATAPAAAD